MPTPFKVVSFMAAEDMARKKEKLIEAAITAHLGNPVWTEDMMADRCSFDILPSGAEIFKVDGVELLHFAPIQFDYEMDGQSIRIRAKQDYAELNR